MEHSVLDKIFGNCIRFYYEGWRNGKKGAISLIGGGFRFIEMTRGSHGNLDDLYEEIEDNPVVAVGIVAYWLMYKSGKHNIITRLSGFITSHPIRQIFDKYTNDYFIHFTNIHSGNPDAWNWDWDYEFYAKYIIPLAVSQNRISEALFDYISDEDIKLVRSVMRNYVQYLKQVRLEKGYKDIPELKVLRSIDSQNVDMLEDMENYEYITILDSLEEKGYVKVAWVEGHSPEDIRILDKGRSFMKQLETEERGILLSDEIVDTLTLQQKTTDNYKKDEKRVVDIDKISNVLKRDFNKKDFIPILKNLLEQHQKDKTLARAALIIYESTFFIKNKYPTFSDWYKDFCNIVQCSYHSSYEPNKLKDGQYIKQKSQYWFL